MAISRPSQFSSPLAGMPSMATPSMSDILGKFPSYASGISALSQMPNMPSPAQDESSLLLDSIMNFGKTFNQPQQRAQLPTAQRPQIQPFMAPNLTSGLDLSILNEVLNPQPMPQMSLLDFIQLLGGQ